MARVVEPKLQLAIDAPEHFALIPRLHQWFDIIEVGTPVLKRFGLSAISTALELADGTPVLADTKTVDGGALEAEMVFGAGASMMTVIAHAASATRAVTQEIAAKHGATVIFDTILDGEFDPSDLLESTDELWLALHNPSDARLAGAGDQQAHISRVSARLDSGCRVSLAGGIGRDNLASVLLNAPDVIVIGSSVTGAQNPEEESAWIASNVAAMRG